MCPRNSRSTLPAVPVRALLALTSVLVIAWTGVLLRNHELGRDAALRAFFGPKPDPAERARDLERLEDAQFLDPNAYWKIASANYQLMLGNRRAATLAAERLVRDEPENIFAWGTLLRAVEDGDPKRAREAVARIKRLNPLAGRRAR